MGRSTGYASAHQPCWPVFRCPLVARFGCLPRTSSTCVPKWPSRVSAQPHRSPGHRGKPSGIASIHTGIARLTVLSTRPSSSECATVQPPKPTSSFVSKNVEADGKPCVAKSDFVRERSFGRAVLTSKHSLEDYLRDALPAYTGTSQTGSIRQAETFSSGFAVR
jgi:hypothetical protein